MNKAVLLKPFQRQYIMMRHKTGPAHRALAVGVPGDGRSPAALPHPSSHCRICAPAGNVCACSFPSHTCSQCPWTHPLCFLSLLVLPEHTLQRHWAHSHCEREGILPPALSSWAGGSWWPHAGAKGLDTPEGSPPVPALCPLLPWGHLLWRRAAGGVRQAGGSGLCCKPGNLGEIWYERHKLHWVAGLNHSKSWSYEGKKNTTIVSCLFVWDSKESKVMSSGSRQVFH